MDVKVFTVRGAHTMVLHYQKSWTPWVANYAYTYHDDTLEDLVTKKKRHMYADLFAIGFTGKLALGWVWGRWTKRIILGPLQLTHHRRYNSDGTKYRP
jgi:hypothetical protein